MTVLIAHATDADLGEAGRLMHCVLTQDLGGYRPALHADLDDLGGAYLADPRRALFVARLDGELVGTAGVRPCRLRTPPNPDWLALRYNTPSVCELVRVWVGSSARRHGVARALVREAARWATQDAGYETVYLHTDTSAPGAESFWRSLPTVEVHDARPDPYNCVHFELDAEKLTTDAPSR